MLTPRQRELYLFLVAFERQHGYPPTQQQMAQALGLAKSGANRHLAGLVRSGLVKRKPNSPRGVRLA